MCFDTPLDERLRRAERKRLRYRMNPEQRLAAINRDRARRGVPLISDLSEMADRYAGLRNRRQD